MREIDSPIWGRIAYSSFFGITQSNLHKQLIAYGHWFEALASKGWDCYLMTVMFDSINGSPQARLREMQADMVRMYGRLLKRTVRNPSKASKRNVLPIAIFFPDAGYYNHSIRGSREAWVNDGLHLHGCVAATSTARCPETLDVHFAERQSVYQVGRIRRIDVQHVAYDMDYVVDYASKALKRRRFLPDDILVLPRAGAELSTEHPSMRAPQGGNSTSNREVTDRERVVRS